MRSRLSFDVISWLIFFSLNTTKKSDPYIIKPRSVSSTRECDDKPEGALFLILGFMFFLQHQNTIMDYSWLLSRVYMYKQSKLVQNFPSVMTCHAYVTHCLLAVKSHWSPKVINILIIVKVTSFTLNKSDWLKKTPENKNYQLKIEKISIFLTVKTVKIKQSAAAFLTFRLFFKHRSLF